MISGQLATFVVGQPGAKFTLSVTPAIQPAPIARAVIDRNPLTIRSIRPAVAADSATAESTARTPAPARSGDVSRPCIPMINSTNESAK